MFYGTRKEMLILLSSMIKFFKPQPLWGDDQAIINYLFYNRLVPIKNIFESNADNGKFINIGLLDVYIVKDKITTLTGNIPAVIHQWDMYKATIQLVDKLYHEENFQPDENFTDIESAFDKVSCLVQRKNFRAATKFFINYIFYMENLNLYGEKILKLYRLTLLQYTHDAEILIMAIQQSCMVAFINNLEINQMEEIYELFTNTEKFSHCISPIFKMFVKNKLLVFADILYRNNRQDLGQEYIRRLSDWRD